MRSADDVSRLLARLPDGTRVLSTVLPDQAPPGHVYRVVSSSGAVLREFSTLVELNTFLNTFLSEEPSR